MCYQCYHRPLQQFHHPKRRLEVDHIVVDLRVDPVASVIVVQGLLQSVFWNVEALGHFVAVTAAHLVGPDDPGQSDQSVVRPDPAAELLLAVGRDALIEDVADCSFIVSNFFTEHCCLLAAGLDRGSDQDPVPADPAVIVL